MTKRRKTEVTSARIAKIAARVQNIMKRFAGDYDMLFVYVGDEQFGSLGLRLQDVGALAGSALSQTANRPKPKKYGPLVLRPGITAGERKRAKALIAASAKKPKKKRVRK